MHVLVTGGTGYIGSHTCVELINAGHRVTVVDNLSNSKPAVLERIEQITGTRPAFHEADILDGDALEQIFSASRVDTVIHFAGLKSVAESVSHPLAYYRNNIAGTASLCTAMAQHGVTDFVFSSSATVYGNSDRLPLDESLPVTSTNATNPYGRTKIIIEELLRDVALADSRWNVALLRYFNPAGAHPSGLIGEDPSGIPANLMPYITQVAVGSREKLTVFGDDYETEDGTAVRDYIHVVDLAVGHLAAIDKLSTAPGVVAYNLGTGRGTSVFEMVHAFERANDIEIPFEVGPRRPGDAPASYTDPSRARTELAWQATRSLEEMCRDAWRWQQKNPEGFP